MKVAHRRLAGLSLAFLGALCLASAQDASEWRDVDWDAVKRGWARLSDAQREHYLSLALARSAEHDRALGGPAKTAGEDCDGAEFEITSLPFTSKNSTIDHLDANRLSQFGACAGGGVQFSSTGVGPDLAYKIKTDLACDLRATLTPTTEDLSLYVVTDCLDSAQTCLRVSDGGARGEIETVDFSAIGGETYFVIVDGFSGQSDDFTLTLEETGAAGCTLVPVELQQFSVE